MSEERLLIDRAVRGETAALERLAAAHRPEAYRIALAILGDADGAEDIAQDMLVRLAAVLPGFRGDAELRTWVHRVTLNLCRDQLRRQRRHADARFTALQDDVDPAVGPDTVDRERARVAVSAAVDRLPDEQREVLMLRYIADLPYAEIARLTSTAQGTVASRVFRALRRLGDELDPRHMEVLQ